MVSYVYHGKSMYHNIVLFDSYEYITEVRGNVLNVKRIAENLPFSAKNVYSTKLK